MLPPPLRDTADILRKLPGIGPRQALRCAFYVLRHPETREDLKRALDTLGAVKNCSRCWRALYSAPNASDVICALCRDTKRESHALCVVEEDTDLEQMEKAGVFKGKYFVLGGRLSLSQDPHLLRVNELKQRVIGDPALKELIMAMSPTPEGNAAFLWLKQAILEALGENSSLTITRLGIGMPAGGEIEYADEETLRGALEHRS